MEGRGLRAGGRQPLPRPSGSPAALRQELFSALECLESLFGKACLKEKDLGPGGPGGGLAVSALLAWALLLTICPASELRKRLETYVSTGPRCMAAVTAGTAGAMG